MEMVPEVGALTGSPLPQILESTSTVTDSPGTQPVAEKAVGDVSVTIAAPPPTCTLENAPPEHLVPTAGILERSSKVLGVPKPKPLRMKKPAVKKSTL